VVVIKEHGDASKLSDPPQPAPHHGIYLILNDPEL
jgi:hypothetical protein